MTYEQFKPLKPSAFKRRCGVQPETFKQMVEVLRPQLDRTGKRGGQCKLCVEDQLLLALEYWLWISNPVSHCYERLRPELFPPNSLTSWGLSESAVCRLIRKVETLQQARYGKFRLPGRKQLYQNADRWSVLVVDATESPIERPQKNSALTIVARISSTLWKPK